MMRLIFLFLFCVSSASAAKSASPVAAAQEEIATLAGGCFWGMEELFRSQPGVTGVEAGYTGGTTDNAVYDLVKTGATGHAESIQIKFDPKKTSYEQILKFFFKIHDPTTKNRQGNDVGTQYRSAIFYHGEKQKQTAELVLTLVEKSKAWKQPIVTEIKPFTKWHRAEESHQDYLQKNPKGYTCHFVRNIEF